MAFSDTQAFIEDLLLRYDPNLDLSQGGAVQTQIVAPILARLGTDPFDTDVATFVTARIQETHPTLSITEADALQDVLISPMRVLIESVSREVRLVKLRSHIENVESISDSEVDSLVGN